MGVGHYTGGCVNVYTSIINLLSKFYNFMNKIKLSPLEIKVITTIKILKSTHELCILYPSLSIECLILLVINYGIYSCLYNLFSLQWHLSLKCYCKISDIDLRQILEYIYKIKVAVEVLDHTVLKMYRV